MKVNYHTHTSRCHHAVGTDEAYVQAGIRAGFDVLGFADHAPFPFASGYVSGIRMTMEELPGYLASVAGLRERFAGEVNLLTGFEAEYFPRYRDHLLRLREKGYLILGQHFADSEEDNPYVGDECASDDGVRRYADSVAEAIRTGLFLYVAHPDLMMRQRTPEQFNRACEEAADTICQAAREADLPLEYNLLGLSCDLQGQSRGYPCPAFWERVAARHANRVILGVDAHNPALLEDTGLWDEGIRRLEALGLERVEMLEIG